MVHSFGQTVDAPDIQFVSINPYTNEVSIAWLQSTNTNIEFTRIHYVYDKTSIIKALTIIDIPENKDDTLIFKTDTIGVFTTQADEAPLSFATDAYTNTNENSISLDKYHTTMIVESSVGECGGEITLSWNPYQGYDAIVSNYTIVEVTGINTETTIAEVPANQTSYIISPNGESDRRFFIEATIETNGTAYTTTSQMMNITEESYTYPENIYISSISCSVENYFTLHIETDAQSDFTSHIIERSFLNRINFVPYDTIAIPRGTAEFTYIIPQKYSSDSLFFYKITAVDDCGNSIVSSQIVNPIEVRIQTFSEHEHFLSWDKGLMWEEEYDSCKIYRVTNMNHEEKIATLPASEESYVDEITDFAIDPHICYYIVATQKRDSMPNTTQSHYACVDKESHVYVPNTFNPHSSFEENRIFKPKYAYIAGTYTMQIFSRNGSKIFESSDINKGWDGTIRNKAAAEGTYLYAIHITLPNGENISKNGAINLIFQSE
ncbi:MAG: gliding motility-associated C-terminal domain-containing protein [Bacteroidales bacterium]|nr:gliding motility-associated C-terminal domain-containing protein [Bacteroidales bacterium]